MVHFFIDRVLPLGRTLIILSILLMGVFTVIIIEKDSRAYEEALVTARGDAERLLHIISDHVELSFLAADITLKRAIERQHINELFGSNLNQDLQNHLTVWVESTPQIAAMLITDGEGKQTAFHSRFKQDAWRRLFKDVSNKPFFLNPATAPDPQFLYIEAGNVTLPIKDEYILMSRKILGLNGQFDGIVLAVVDGNYLMDYFRSLEKGKQTSLVVMREDRKTLVRGMADEELESINAMVEDVLNNINKTKLMVRRKVDTTKLATTHKVSKETDVRVTKLDETLPALKPGNMLHIQEDDKAETFKIFSFSHLKELGLVIALTNYEEDIFGSWKETRTNYLILLGTFASFVLVISMFAIAMSIQTRRAEESEQSAVMASQAKSEFLAHMSHELRTPLNAVIGFSEMLQTGYFGKLNAKQTERISDIHGCGNHLLELINDILEFSKGDAGKLELREEVVNLPTLIDDVVRLFKERLRNEDITLDMKIQDRLPKMRGDARKIKQVLLNLVSNATKFTKKGGTIEITARQGKEGDIAFIINDTGIGMSDEDIPKALSAFGQVHEDPSYGGTGLGLPLCKMLAEMHGGSLKIRSKKDVGTKVTVTFPKERVVST